QGNGYGRDKMIATADGGYLVFGVLGYAQPQTIIQKFGPDLSLQFEKTSYEFTADFAVQTADGGYLLCARIPGSSLSGNIPGDKVAFVKLTPKGNLDRAYALGGTGNEDYYHPDLYPCAAVL